MTILLILPLLLGNFVEKWVIPDGKASYGTIEMGDFDHDGLIDIIVRRSLERKVMFYELGLQNQWLLQDSIVDDGDHLIWDAGDFDLDGNSDLVFQKSFGMPNVGIAVYESPDSFSYPTQEVWRDTVGFALVTPICVHDIDQDSLPEIVKIIGDTTDFDIYESVSDNSYVRIFRDTIPANHSPMSTLAVGDFDMDAANEFVMGYSGGEYSIWECIGNNLYQEILFQQLPTASIKDCFSVPDADGDGKIEFVVKGYVISSAEIHAFIFEATGDNTYEIIKTFTLWGGDYYGGYSDVGDVDGDSIPEIALEGRQTVHIIKAAGNDSFYVWETLPGNASGSSVRVYDVDGNGLSEVIISGNNETRIYEYQVGIEEAKKLLDLLSMFAVHPNPFTNTLDIRFNPQYTGEITVNVYDVSGRLIKNLHCGSIEGNMKFTWLGDDNYGRQTPQGVYFVRIEYPGLEQTCCEKIIRMK